MCPAVVAYAYQATVIADVPLGTILGDMLEDLVENKLPTSGKQNAEMAGILTGPMPRARERIQLSCVRPPHCPSRQPVEKRESSQRTMDTGHC